MFKTKQKRILYGVYEQQKFLGAGFLSSKEIKKYKAEGKEVFLLENLQK